MSKAKMLGGSLLGATGAVGGALGLGKAVKGDHTALLEAMASGLPLGNLAYDKAVGLLALGGAGAGAGVAHLLSRSGAAKLQAAARAKKMKDAATAAALLGGGAAGGYALGKSDS